MTVLKDLEITYDKPHWCPGCGNFGNWVSLKNAIVQLGLNPWEVVLVSGIGCASKTPYWVRTYGFNTLHGRPIPVAEGIKMANHNLTVIVVVGDGGQYGEGLNHLIHAARRNANITVVVHNNQLYSLTTGQYCPTTALGEKNKATPVPIAEEPINPVSLAISAGATFVARGFAGDNKFETGLMVEAIKHKGFSVIDSMVPCVTFNHKNTFSFFYEKVYKLENENHDSSDRIKAITKAEEWPLRNPLISGQEEKIPIGVFYKEERKTWEENTPQISESPLVKQSIESIDINPLIETLL